MKAKWPWFGVAVVLLLLAVCLPDASLAAEAKKSAQAWREKAVEYARIPSSSSWPPTTSGGKA